MTRQLSRQQSVLLGAVVLIGVSLATWVVLSVNQRRGLGSDAFAVEANFADVGGVEVGTRVRCRGWMPAKSWLWCRRRLREARSNCGCCCRANCAHLVTADARVQIASDNLFPSRHVRILPGTAAAGLAAEGACLASVPFADLADAITHVNSALEDASQGKGTLGLLLKDEKVARDLAQTVAHINELSQSFAQVNSMINDVHEGKGSLGAILKDPTLYNELLATVTEVRTALGQDVRRLVVSVRQNSDAIKSLPVVRSYVIDAHKELVRPDCQRFCKWFPESDLFEPGRAVLTTSGRKLLDDAARWLNSHKEPGSEVVIASFASVNQNPDVAQTVTQKQSEAVCAYLRNTHSVHSTGWWWWSTRSVRAVGVGTNHPALPEADRLPGSRIELLVFIPGK